MRNWIIAAAGTCLVVAYAGSTRVPIATAAGALPPLTTLAPGAPVRLPETLDVNVVLIGFEQGGGPQQIDTTRFRSLLPPRSGAYLDDQTLVGIFPIALRQYGVTQQLRYNVVHTPGAFDDAFFGFLTAIAEKQTFSPFGPGVPALPIVPSQFLYDFCNVSPTVDPAFGCSFAGVPRVNNRFILQNYFIDARVVEQVLGDALPFAGVDTTKHTVVLINWWGRPDFIDHIYYHAADHDPDTGVQAGLYFTQMVSGWGGTAFNDPEDCPAGCPVRRLMYLDVSASPTERLANWDITSPDVRSLPAPNGIADDRLPPIWEYGNVGYRPFDDLTGDLAAKFVGDVFVSLVATANPVYWPALSPPRQPTRIEVDLTLFDTVPGVNTSSLVSSPALTGLLSVLPYTFTVESSRQTAMPPRLADAYSCFRFGLFPTVLSGDSCYGQRVFGAAGADLYTYFRDHAFEYIDGDADYEVPAFRFHVPDAQRVPFVRGYADSNWADEARQTFVYGFSSPRTFGPEFIPVGFTATLAHEVGHHLGLKHPHDGYICADSTCGEPRYIARSDDTFYSWLGDQQSSNMSYIAANDDFGQFDLDNLDRYLTYTYLSLSNAALAKIASNRGASQVAAAITAADADAAAARLAYTAMQYRSAVVAARRGYNRLLGAIDLLHIPFDASDWHGDFRTPADDRHTWSQFVREANVDAVEPQVDFLKRAGIPLVTRRVAAK